MVVVHDQKQKRDTDDSTERRRRKAPLVHRYSENFEDRITERDVYEDEQEFHQRSPTPSVLLALIFVSTNCASVMALSAGASDFGRFSSVAIRWRRSATSLARADCPDCVSVCEPEKPHPRSGRYAIAHIHRNGHSTCRVKRLRNRPLHRHSHHP